MNSVIKSSKTADDYFNLVRAFPLRPIRTASQHEAAGKVLNRLLGRPGGKLSAGERDYVEALARFVEDYESAHHPMTLAKRAPLDVLKYLMEETGLGTVALGRILGTTHNAASMILHGKRGISKAAAKSLAAHFKVDVGLFL